MFYSYTCVCSTSTCINSLLWDKHNMCSTSRVTQYHLSDHVWPITYTSWERFNIMSFNYYVCYHKIGFNFQIIAPPPPSINELDKSPNFCLICCEKLRWTIEQGERWGGGRWWRGGWQYSNNFVVSLISLREIKSISVYIYNSSD